MKRKLQHRARIRGAATVEGVVAIPFFILMFAGTMFVGGRYAKQIDTFGLARKEVWNRALAQSCDSGSNGNLEDLTIVDSADLGELSKSPLAALCDKDFGSVTYSARSSHEVTGPVEFSQDIKATVVMPCNETPIAGDVAYEAAVTFLWDAYQANGLVPPDDASPSTLIGFLFGGWGYDPLYPE